MSKIEDRKGKRAEAAIPRFPNEQTEPRGARVAKVMARSGLCSRREAERWISEGRVKLNNVPLESPAVSVERRDKITVDGNPLTSHERTRLFLFHKPRGLVTTNRDPEGRPTVFGFFRQHSPHLPRLMSIGRLDINSEGLLLLTNDGGLARVLEHPRTGWTRRYRVRAHGVIDPMALEKLRQGISIDGIRYAAIELSVDRTQGVNSWLTMTLREGKNREIRCILEHFGLRVNRLIRLSYGPFQLGELKDGAVEEVPTRVLRDQLGLALSAQAQADFSSPRGKRPDDTATPRPLGGAARRPSMRQRRHVSVLRVEGDKPQQQRKRVERRETTDGQGRKVIIEHLRNGIANGGLPARGKSTQKEHARIKAKPSLPKRTRPKRKPLLNPRSQRPGGGRGGGRGEPILPS